MIKRSDRVADVLARDGELLDVFIAAGPVFRGLRNPLMRRTMGRLATVEQAARVAGIDPDLLVDKLKRALAAAPAATPPAAIHPNEGEEMSTDSPDAPAALLSIPPQLVVDLDVREDLRNGQEPFSRIMAARREVPPGGALRLRAIFEPVPLYAVMAKQGLDHWTEELADDDWRVSFYPAAPASPATRAPLAPPTKAGPAPTAATDDLPDTDTGGGAEDVIVLDVRGMEPPEPMVRTLAALEELEPGRTLLQINERIPEFLLPKLRGLGFTYVVREQSDSLFRIFIRRREES